MEPEKPTKILPETDGWDDAAKEHPRIVWIHRLFIAAAIFCALIIAALAALYFLPVSIKQSKDYEYHVRRLEYWFKKNSTGQKLEVRYGKENRWNADGKLIWQRDWSGDKWDGWEKEWYPTGQLRNKQEWKDGKKDGIDRYWYANGQLWRETHWKDDVQQGDAQVWDESGKSVDEPKTAKTLDLGDGVKLELMLIPAGEFMMGSDIGEDEEKPVHRVKITQPFYMGKFEVTQEQYEKVMGTNPSNFKRAKNPVECVSHDDTIEFCRKLSQKTVESIMLPTEAQWEKACRADSITKFYYGNDVSELGDYAWYANNSGFPRFWTHPVGQKIPNALGLYDMSGNVQECCLDYYGSYPDYEVNDPVKLSSSDDRVLRGGSSDYIFDCCRSTHRDKRTSNSPSYNNGFRIVAIKSP